MWFVNQENRRKIKNTRYFPCFQSGHWDLNPGPLAPHASALAGLRHAPNNVAYYTLISPTNKGFFAHQANEGQSIAKRIIPMVQITQ